MSNLYITLKFKLLLFHYHLSLFSLTTSADTFPSLLQVDSQVHACRWYFLELQLDFFSKDSSPMLVKDFKPAHNRDCSIRIKKVKLFFLWVWSYKAKTVIHSSGKLVVFSCKLSYQIWTMSARHKRALSWPFMFCRSERSKRGNGSVRPSSSTPQISWWLSLSSSELSPVSCGEFLRQEILAQQQTMPDIYNYRPLLVSG